MPKESDISFSDISKIFIFRKNRHFVCDVHPVILVNLPGLWFYCPWTDFSWRVLKILQLKYNQSERWVYVCDFRSRWGNFYSIKFVTCIYIYPLRGKGTLDHFTLANAGWFYSSVGWALPLNQVSFKSDLWNKSIKHKSFLFFECYLKYNYCSCHWVWYWHECPFLSCYSTCKMSLVFIFKISSCSPES